MYNRSFIILLSLLVGVAYTDVILPTLPPLIQQFARIESCTMTVYIEPPPIKEYKFINGRFQVVFSQKGGEQSYCCKGWEDVQGDYEGGTAVCSRQQANATPYVTTEEYSNVLAKVAEIRSAYDQFKALRTATALAEKAKALIVKVSEQQTKIKRLQLLLSQIIAA